MDEPALSSDNVSMVSRREAPRTNLFLSAVLVGEDVRLPVTVRNLSSSGAMIETREDFKAAAPLSLVRGSLNSMVTWVWTNGRRAGVKFENPIEVGLWIPQGSSQAQVNVDRMLADRRAQASAVPAQSRPSATAEKFRVGLVNRIAEELAFAARKLEKVGSSLADDPTVIVRHSIDLQELDITIQVLGHLARLINSEEPEALLETLGMHELKRRLGRTSIS